MVDKNLTALATALLIAILLLSSGVLRVGQLNNLTAEAQPVLPFTDTTNGNAWNGLISYSLSGPGGNYAVIMNANGTILYTRSSASPYGVVKNIALNTFLFQGEPQVDGLGYDPTYATHIWNPVTNTMLDFPNVVGHHDVAYDPLNNTFLTLQTYARTVGSDTYLIDRIVQFDALGNILWTWDAYNYIPLYEQDPYNLTAPYDGTQVTDFTHSNALIWDYQNDVIYLNVRHINTFYKIDQNTGNVIWSCGQYGTITLVDGNGNPLPYVNGYGGLAYPPSLWFHSHDLEMVGPDVFTMFDNDYDNTTNFNDATSELLEITVNETSMTAQTTWNWEAPPQYYTEYLGANILLPNGDWMGDFGSPTHQFEENYPWNFVDSGADIIEVTPAGQIVRTISFPTGWSIYRVSLVTEFNASASSPVAFGNMNAGSSNQWGNSQWLASSLLVPTSVVL